MVRKGKSPAPSRAFSAFTTIHSNVAEVAEHKEHPCNHCIAPCCTTVTLHEFEPQTFRDVDYLGYLIGFSRIELGWLPSGTVEINYRAFCTNFDSKTAGCKVHGTDEQPLMCTEYDAHQCTYKAQFLGDQSTDMLRVSAARFESIARQFSYDPKGTIVKRPTFAEISLGLESSENEKTRSYELKKYGPTLDPLPIPGVQAEEEPLSHQKLRSNPCSGCAAYCCRVLVFPLPAPSDRREVSFYRYIAGFPGLEVALTPRGYIVQCFSKCQHLTESNQCELFNKARRPVFCSTYDAWRCSFVPTYKNGTSLLRRLNRDEWAIVESMFCYGEEGGVTHIPVYEEVIEALNPKQV